MGTAAVALGTLVLGAFVGYAVRLREFQREQRVAVYAEFVGAFLDAAHAGSALISIYMQLGNLMFTEEHQAESKRWWEAFGTAASSFEAAGARLRIVAGSAAKSAGEELEEFLLRNVQRVPPLYRTESTAEWGDAAKIGPAKIDSEAGRLAHEFAERVRPEVVSLRGR